MNDTTITLTAIIGFAAGAMAVGMWLWPAVSRIRTERDRLQEYVNALRLEDKASAERIDRYRTECRLLTNERDDALSDSDVLTNKVTRLTADCVEFQRLAHEAQDGLDMAKDLLSGEMSAHAATKRQLAAAKGQITKLKRRIDG